MRLIFVGDDALFGPGDRVRFRLAHDITATVLCTTIYGEHEVYYRIVWIDSGKRHEEQVSAHEVEPAA